MKEVLIFAGTTEGRRLSDWLCERKIPNTVCVATEYGELVLKEDPFRSVRMGRMEPVEMRSKFLSGVYGTVIDATHPYAAEVTKNIRQAVCGCDISYYRLLRETEGGAAYEQMKYFGDSRSCAEALTEVKGNILLTTGSKELEIYSKEEIKDRLYVRVLPGIESLEICKNQGICGKQIVAMQGPFSTELNEALIRQYQIACLVTKESGKAGGYAEKIEAARRTGIPVYVVGKPKEEEGLSFAELCKVLEGQIAGTKSSGDLPEIILAGIGMGNRESMTKEVEEAICDADVLMGAERMIEEYQPRIEKKPYYLASQILPYIKELTGREGERKVRKIVILFSGDSGFYSGCQKMYDALREEIEKGNLRAVIRIMPGISSVSYLASCLGESYQDAVITSIHGKSDTALRSGLLHKVKTNEKTFLLLSGMQDVSLVGEMLSHAGLNDCVVYLGYRLSYSDQRIEKLTPAGCQNVTEEGLYTCLIKNPYPEKARLTHGIADSEFLRDTVPMTKEEVREVSICKLHLTEDAVVYDVGSGSGSVAVEMAGISNRIQVYAMERKPEAAALMQKNKEKFQAHNMHIIQAYAPEGLEALPMATHAFLGGSGGKMQEILEALYRKNPQMRIVINAVTLETLCEIKEVLSRFKIKNESMVQMQVSRTRKAGDYHLMQAENPVWICAFTFVPEEMQEGEGK